MAVDSPHRLQRAVLGATVICLALIASGCTKFMYNRLDSIGDWFVSSLVTLDPDQRAAVRNWLTRTHEWHRSSELHRYVDFLRQLSERAAAPAEQHAYDDVVRQLESFGEAVVAQASPEAARLLLELSPAQVNELAANLDERGRKRARESLKLLENGEWREKRARDLKRQLKRWTGDVTDEQEELIERAAAQFEPTTQEWLDSQRQWREALIATLRDAAGDPGAEARVVELLRKPDAHWTHSYAVKNQRNRQRSAALIAALDHSLTPRQREHLQGELSEIAEQLDALRKT